jgi:hypothetical protein
MLSFVTRVDGPAVISRADEHAARLARRQAESVELIDRKRAA